MTPTEVLRPLLRGDEHFAVTGATGWFGSTALDLLDELLGEQAAERVTAYASRPRTMRTAAGRTVEVHALSDLASSIGSATHVLHFAFLTRDRAAELGIPDYLEQNLQITATVLGAISRLHPRGLLTTSSGAVYGKARDMSCDLTGNPYGTLKHIDELALRQAMADIGGTSVVARVFSVAGRGITSPELYALGAFITMAQAGGPVRVRAQGSVVRSYVGVAEVLAVGLWSLLSEIPLVFDSGGHVVEMGELAALVAQLHGLPPEAVERTLDPDAPEDRYIGEPGQMAQLAEHCGLDFAPLAELVEQTAAGMRAGGRSS